MYVPRHFATTDPALLASFIAQHDFATLVGSLDGESHATHLPLLLDRDGTEHGTLRGHVARANPLWRALGEGAPVLAIFHGPHAYVSPSWYESAPAVPTWNYAVVHAYGRAAARDDPAWVRDVVHRLTEIHEAGMREPWRPDLPADFERKMLAAIVGIEIRIERLEGKLKLGQNRSAADRLGTVRALATSADAGARALAELTAEHLGLK